MVELNILALLSYADRIIEEVEIPVDAPGWIAGLMTIFKGLVGEFRALNGKVAEVVELESLLIVQKNTTDVLKNENDRFNKRINSLEMIVDNYCILEDHQKRGRQRAQFRYKIMFLFPTQHHNYKS